MRHILPFYPGTKFEQQEKRTIVARDLQRLAAMAQELRSTWSLEQPFFRSQFMALALALLMPMVGIGWLGWSAREALFFITFDFLMLALTDWVRYWTAAEEVLRAGRALQRSHYAIEVLRGLDAARRGKSYEFPTSVDREYGFLRRLFVEGTAIAMMLTVPLAVSSALHGRGLLTPGLLALCGFSASWHVAHAFIMARQARRSEAPVLTILPQAAGQVVTLAITLVVLLGVALSYAAVEAVVALPEPFVRWSLWPVTVVLSLGLLLWVWRTTVEAREKRMRRFLAQPAGNWTRKLGLDS